MSLNLNLADLDLVDSDEPITRANGTSGPGRPAEPNPFGPVIVNAAETGKTKVLTVTNDAEKGKNGAPKNVTKIMGLIRRAADEANFGVRMTTTADGDKTVIRFSTKVKTVRARKVKDETPAAAAPVVAEKVAEPMAEKVKTAPKPAPKK